MSHEGRLSIARLLTLLLDEENCPPWLPVVLTPIMVGGFFWIVTNASQHPTQAEDRHRASQQKAQALITDKYLNVRHQSVLVIKQGTLLTEEINWGNTFFSAAALKEGFPISSHEAYVELERQSLVAHAQSLLKRAGDSTAILKRGQQLRVFYFHSLWP